MEISIVWQILRKLAAAVEDLAAGIPDSDKNIIAIFSREQALSPALRPALMPRFLAALAGVDVFSRTD